MEELALRFTPGADGMLSPLKPFFDDTQVSEILINKPGEVFVERLGTMEQHLIPRLDAMHLKRLFTLIANENGQCLSTSSPLLSGSLSDGSRVQLVIPPAAKNYTLSIRRPSIKKLCLADYRASSFYQGTRAFYLDEDLDSALSEPEKELINIHQQGGWADFIELAVSLKKNIVVSGETSSGKTTYLNACTAHIPHHERIITLEDTYEVDIPHANVVNLRAPKKGENEQGGLCMQDLVQCALRLRPDRLIMGEIRGREILDFISACSTGHEGSITSIHASNPRIAFMRMTQLYKQNNVPSMRDEDIQRELHAVIDVIVQVRRAENGREAPFIYYKEARSKNCALMPTHQQEKAPNHVH